MKPYFPLLVPLEGRSVLIVCGGAVSLRKAEKHEHYFDYKVARAARRKKPSNMLLWVGLAFVAAAGVCLAGYALA